MTGDLGLRDSEALLLCVSDTRCRLGRQTMERTSLGSLAGVGQRLVPSTCGILWAWLLMPLSARSVEKSREERYRGEGLLGL